MKTRPGWTHDGGPDRPQRHRQKDQIAGSSGVAMRRAQVTGLVCCPLTDRRQFDILQRGPG
jgi:hypothetical protein